MISLVFLKPLSVKRFYVRGYKLFVLYGSFRICPGTIKLDFCPDALTKTTEVGTLTQSRRSRRSVRVI